MEFRPDVIHITGLNDIGIIGAYLAWKLRIPLIGSWHTNIHEFAAERLRRSLRFLPKKMVKGITGFAERKILDGAVLYYKMPKVVLAPNEELIALLGKGTNRTARMMARGVDTQKFSPEKRTVSDGQFRIGFVGRLRPEKNVRMLLELEKELIRAGKTNFRFLIVGEGTERDDLEKELQFADFTGFIDGEELSTAYANMDVFLFPSETDAFGNVVQEAAASGVPSIVSDKGGPKYLVEEDVTGFIATSLSEFAEFTMKLIDDPAMLASMRAAARERAISKSWDTVFAGVFDAYHETVSIAQKQKEASTNGAGSK
jgi:phosphatidylinositol alpha 1,6-mannosyltransferase